MWDIALCDVRACRDKQAYMKLLESTAKEIFEKLRR